MKSYRVLAVARVLAHHLWDLFPVLAWRCGPCNTTPEAGPDNDDHIPFTHEHFVQLPAPQPPPIVGPDLPSRKSHAVSGVLSNKGRSDMGTEFGTNSNSTPLCHGLEHPHPSQVICR